MTSTDWVMHADTHAIMQTKKRAPQHLTSEEPPLLQVLALHCTDIHIKIKDKTMAISATLGMARLLVQKLEIPVHQQRGFEDMNEWFAYILAKPASMDFK